MTNTKKLSSLFLFLLLGLSLSGIVAQAQRPKPDRKPGAAKKDAAAKDAPATNATTATESEDELSAELEAVSVLPLMERVERLRAFIKAHPKSSHRGRAAEMLTGARAALGDEKLQAGDTAAGVELFRQAVAEAPAEMSEKLFVGVISQLPANLFIRGARGEAFDLARRIEEQSKTDPQRLLVLTTFYLSVEQPDEAARVAELVIKLRPDNAAARQALGTAHRIALRLDAAATEFSRALELDARSTGARRSLADLRRAAGRAEEALALYRELSAADPLDMGARNGVVLSLFDAGKKEEAEKELTAALAAEPRNMVLLTGAAYWYAAQDNGGARALELASQAIAIEPRYTWAHIALARALVVQKRPLDAENSLRFVRQYGRFPTLDYELANAMAAAGLYDEAAEELARTFSVKDGQIEAQLAGRVAARADNFLELLAPERRASIFQPVAADTQTNTRRLKALLAFHLAMNPPPPTTGRAAATAATAPTDEVRAVEAAKEFVAGNDEMRTFRHLYVASRLLRRGIAFTTAFESTEAAVNGVEAALDSPAASVAVAADELRDVRARAIAAGRSTNFPAVPRTRLSNVLRGRIEEVAGRALLNQGNAAAAVVRLKRATSVLPENTTWWRDALWHLGAALDASGSSNEALTSFLRSYDRRAPDPARRAVIEVLYRKVNGSLQGLEEKLGAASTTSSVSGITTTTTTTPTTPAVTTTATAANNTPVPTVESTGTTTTTTTTGGATNVSTSPVTTTEPNVTPTTAPATPAVVMPLPEQSTAAPTPEATTTTTTAAAAAAPTTPVPVPESPSQEKARVETGNVTCRMSISEAEITLRNNGGSRTVTVTLDGASGKPNVSPTTTNWSDIFVASEPQPDPNTFRFTITSVSKATGTFTVAFSSPCGKQPLQITIN